MNAGSEFTVELTLSRAQPSASALDPDETLTRGFPGLDGVRVLVADDSDMNLEVVKAILELEGANVALARNGQEAFDRLQADAHDFDVVLMDVQMPLLDGHAATRLIRSELGLVDLPIIALTAGALSSERDRAAAAGTDDFLLKPFESRNTGALHTQARAKCPTATQRRLCSSGRPPPPCQCPGRAWKASTPRMPASG